MLPRKRFPSDEMLPPTFRTCRADAWGDASSAEVGPRKRQRKEKRKKNTNVTVSVVLIMQCGWIGGGVVVVVVGTA